MLRKTDPLLDIAWTVDYWVRQAEENLKVAMKHVDAMKREMTVVEREEHWRDYVWVDRMHSMVYGGGISLTTSYAQLIAKAGIADHLFEDGDI